MQQRLPDPSQSADLQQGKIESFRYQLFRFTSALEDKDQESVDVLKEVLLDAIRQETAAGEARKKAGQLSPAQLENLDKQQRLQLKITKTTFSVTDDSLEKAKEKARLFEEYLLMVNG